MKRSTRLLVCLVLLLAAGCTPPAEQQPAPHSALVDSLTARLDQLRLESGFPGATLGVVMPDGALLTTAVGVADLESGEPMTPSHRMLSGSIGKTYVAAVLLQLAAEGRIDLEERIADWFSDEPWFPRLPNGEEITVRMLASHTGGLPRYVLEEAFWQAVEEDPDRVWRPEELLAFVLDREPVHDAGQGWAYSDTDFILLGMIIERVTGRPYYSELADRILGPLGLEATSPSTSRTLAGLAAGYTGDNQPPFHLPRKMATNGVYAINPQFEWTGGGLITTAAELARWAHALYGGRVLPADWLTRMLTPVGTGEEIDFEYGLGAQIWATDLGPAYGHGGTMPGFQSQMEHYPEHGFTIAIQVNADRFSGMVDHSPGALLAELAPLIAHTLHREE